MSDDFVPDIQRAIVPYGVVLSQIYLWSYLSLSLYWLRRSQS